jgi:phospholipase/carboxylesterase
MATHPHAGQPVLQTGAPLESANAVMILIHGRGASARDILSLTTEFEREDVTYLAPQAAGGTWYPYSFLAPIAQNEPFLSSALGIVGALVAQVEGAGFRSEQIMLLGFSQGACLASEFMARNAKRYGALFALSGGLIGPDGTPRDYSGSLNGTSIFMGCSDVDFHIPKERVLESADVFRELGAEVDARLYPNMGHTINEDELKAVRDIMAKVGKS